MPDDRYELTTHDGKTVDRYTDYNLYLAEERLGYPLTIVQGSYHPGVGASAGTHDGGGVVDLAPWDWERKVRVLRELGFAAWYRPNRPGVWPAHIHAVLLGNEKASPLAKQQMNAYAHGRDGLAGNGYDGFWRPNPIKPAAYKTEATMSIDLSNQKLTTDIPGPDGHALEVKQPRLDRYDSDSFHRLSPGGPIRMRVHRKGATTPNSKKTRTELREQTNHGQDPASWSNVSGSHTQSETLAVTKLDKGESVVVAQIHDAVDEVTMIRATGLGGGYFKLDAGRSLGKGKGDEWKPLVAKYRLGIKFKVTTYATRERVLIRLNNEHDAEFKGLRGKGWYFKAGAYLQAGEWAEIVLYALDERHAA